MSEHPNALEVRSLRAGYGRYDVVHDVSLHASVGESVGLLGPNGAGKSTVLRSIMGLIRRRHGEIRIAGVDVVHMHAYHIAKGLAAIVPEGRRLFLNLSVEDNLRVGGLPHRRDPERFRSLLGDVFELFPVVQRYRNRPASTLSGGEQQMVAIGRMMMNDPALMLLDEPSLGLAPLAVRDMADGLLGLKARGKSILLVEQRVDLALQVCDRIYVLSEGAVVEEKITAEIHDTGRSLIDAYLG